jgi:cellulose synthase/poly-beta-1,6-N-acetylglucosamine synthase-like glycosyltransferase
MMLTALHIFFLIACIYLSINIFYLFAASIFGLFNRKNSFLTPIAKKKIAVLITSYKEDKVIEATINAAANHNYPTEFFDVFLAADQLRAETIHRLKNYRVYITEVNFTSGSKARSLNYLLNRIDEEKYDIALVLDGDNIMEAGFLEKINAAFQNGAHAVQGHRTAKNLNTAVAVLDGISEEINNRLFRKAQTTLGFSASLIGSGMAFDFKRLKEIYNKPGIVDNPACDREVDFELMRANVPVTFLNDAYVFDEKVATENVYENQRRRWLESQLMHLGLFFSAAGRRAPKTKDFWNKLFINLMPPRSLFILLLALVLCFAIIETITHRNITNIPLASWLVLLLLYVLAMLLAIPRKYYRRSTLRAFLHLPVILFTLVKAVFTIRIGRKDFVHTPKSFTGDSETTEK